MKSFNYASVFFVLEEFSPLITRKGAKAEEPTRCFARELRERTRMGNPKKVFRVFSYVSWAKQITIS